MWNSLPSFILLNLFSAENHKHKQTLLLFSSVPSLFSDVVEVRDKVDGQFLAKCILETHQRFCPGKTQGLQFRVNNPQQVLVILGVHFYQQIILSCRIITFHHFRNLFQFLHHIIKSGRRSEENTYESTRLIT